MEAIMNENSSDLAQRLPWSRPQVRRLVISINTSDVIEKSGSTEDICGYGPYEPGVCEE